jgi:biopolymer transport protein ExbB
MKQSVFLSAVVVITLGVALVIYIFVLGNPANFADGETRHVPLKGNLLGTIYTGGIVVPILITLTLMNLTLVFERTFSLRKANGKGPIPTFLKTIQTHLMGGKIDDAIKACDAQRGSAANIIRTGLSRYKDIHADKNLDAEKKMAETKRAIEEATSLETPLLERNLIALSTIASIATMFGLLGTVIGMIRAFTALAAAGGAPDAIQLSIGISEALINTALGLLAAIIGIIAYNFFVTKVDNFTYMIDEASYNVVEILNTKTS